MNEEHPHPLLAQVPLAVSPFLSLPQATTLPHTYRELPSILPPSVTDTHGPSSSSKPAYVFSQATGHSAHPDQIIESCRALQEHLKKMQEDSLRAIHDWEGVMREKELAEKRRVAPGWLDVDASSRGLVPTRIASPPNATSAVVQNANQPPTESDDGGAAIDRAFGGLNIK